MGRKKNVIAPEAKALDKMQADIETVERLYGDGMPYELDRIENEIKFYMTQTAQALFESGKRFLLIKTHEKHGDYIAALERIGVPQTTAAYAMAVVKRFGSNRPALGDLGSAKLKMLTVFEEKDIAEYVKGGPLGEISHDDVAKMTTRELEAEVRKLREKVKKTEAVVKEKIRQKDEQIANLELENEHLQPPTKEQVAQAALQKMTEEYTYALAKVNSSIRDAISLVAKAEKIENVNVQQLNEWLNQFEVEMKTFHGLKDCWLDAVDNAGPQKDWRISDL